MDKTDIYSQAAAVPKEAQRQILAGRLRGKTDINPMWRIRKLTELFGPCGFGWRYTIDRQWLEHGANGETHAFVNISLYVKVDGEWSDAIPGTGGSYYTDTQKGTLYNSDECYKMALTDAISVSCKALGFGADIYWAEGKTKYTDGDKKPTDDNGNDQNNQKPANKQPEGDRSAQQRTSSRQIQDETAGIQPGDGEAVLEAIRRIKAATSHEQIAYIYQGLHPDVRKLNVVQKAVTENRYYHPKQ